MLTTEKHLLRILTFSEYRKDIIFYLRDGPKSRSELREIFNIGNSEIIPRLNELEEAHLISKEAGNYKLTPIGEVAAVYLKPLLDTLDAIETNEDFWTSHDLSSIPKQLLCKIKNLKRCKLVQRDGCVIESQEVFKDNVAISTKFRGATCILFPEWIQIFSKLAAEHADIEIIITPQVYEKIKDEYPVELEQLLQNDARLYVYHETLRIAFANTERFFSLALCSSDGDYDYKSDLIGFDRAAVTWGEELFEYYKSESIEVKCPNIEYVRDCLESGKIIELVH